MPSKKHKPEEIIGKLREVEIVLGQGGTRSGNGSAGSA
jgi:putative transposase